MTDRSSSTSIPPVRKTITVDWNVERAFRRFTEELGDWWPLATHAVAPGKAERCVMEGRAGGRLYEIHRDGSTAEWGRILEWEPPGRVVFSWYPGRDPETGQRVEVRFTALDSGTRVELTHTGWERLGAVAAESRDDYESGWDGVLARYTAVSDID